MSNTNGFKRPHSPQSPEIAPENSKKSKLVPSINSHKNTPITPGCSKTPPGQELCVDSAKNPVVAPENAKNHELGPSINPYNNTPIIAGRCRTTPGREFSVAYKRALRSNSELREKLLEHKDVILKISPMNSSDSSDTDSGNDTESDTDSETDSDTDSATDSGTDGEDSIVSQSYLLYLNKIADAHNVLKAIANMSYDQSKDTGNGSEKKAISASVYNNSLPVEKSSDDKMYIQQTQGKVPNLNKEPKKKCFHDTECLPVKKEKLLCLKRKFIEFEDMPKKVLYTACVHDDILDIEELMKKAQMLKDKN